ncbi:hypothetical protein Hanom_Chr11g01004781 [Helianthus anomalus]
MSNLVSNPLILSNSLFNSSIACAAFWNSLSKIPSCPSSLSFTISFNLAAETIKSVLKIV